MGHRSSEFVGHGSSNGYDTAAEEALGALPPSKHPYEPLSSSEPSTVNLQSAVDGQMKSGRSKHNPNNSYVPLPSGDTSAPQSASNTPGDVSPRHVEIEVLRLTNSGDYHDAADFLLQMPIVDHLTLPFGLQMPEKTGSTCGNSRRNSLDITSRSAPLLEAEDLPIDSTAKLSDISSPALRIGGRRDKSSVLTTSTISLGWLNNLDVVPATNSDALSESTAANKKQIRESGRLFGSYPTPIPARTDADDSEHKSWAAGPAGEKDIPDPVYRSPLPLVSPMTLHEDYAGAGFSASGHKDIPLARLEIKNLEHDDFGNKEDDQPSNTIAADRLLRERMKAAFPEFGPHLVSQLVATKKMEDKENRPGRQQYRRSILPMLLEDCKHPAQIDPWSTGSSLAPPNENSALEISKIASDAKSKWHRRLYSRTQDPTKLKWYHEDPVQTKRLRADSIPATGIFGPHGITSTRTRRVRPSKKDEEFHITVNVIDKLSRQQYLAKLCQALMAYGDPTHRLEQHMKMSAKVLDIGAQFFYIPGCMIISFEDSSAHTTELKLVRTNQSIDLGKLTDAQRIYKLVLHDKICIEEATKRIDEIIKRDKKYGRWFLVIVYGIASASVAPFAFQAGLSDIPAAFFLGSILGFIHVVLAPMSDLHSNIIELFSVVLTCFIAKAIGSYRSGEKPVFCFPALAKSAICILLPGYVVLCAALEMQSRSMIAGSVRMIYALVYSLLLGICISVGASLWGPFQYLVSHNRGEHQGCHRPLDRHWSFLFVPIFAACAAIINGAKWKQIPIMIFIATASYSVSFTLTEYTTFKQGTAHAIAAFTIGVLGNMYSRFFHGFAAAVMMPAIFVQVPNGLAAVESLSLEPVSNITIPGQAAHIFHSTFVLDVGYGMLDIAVSVSIGLLLSGIVCCPCGKKRPGLFSF